MCRVEEKSIEEGAFFGKFLMDGARLAACALGMATHCHSSRLEALRKALLHVSAFVKVTATSWPLTPDSHRAFWSSQLLPRTRCLLYLEPLSVDPGVVITRHSRGNNNHLVQDSINTNTAAQGSIQSHTDTFVNFPTVGSIKLVSLGVGNEGDWCCQSFVTLRDSCTKFSSSSLR